MPRARALFVALVSLAALLGTLAAGAVGRPPYDEAAFTAAQAAGKSILVHVSAPWCPTCKAQKTVLDLVLTKPEYKDVVTFVVDFDTAGETLRKFNARAQSTLIAFKGDKETARSAGDTKTESIEKLIASSL
jgi:thiol-disulfide isomerase/thioredoxin